MKYIELINVISDENPFPPVSGGPSHIQCPSCKTEYMGHRRRDDLIYRCNQCGYTFNIFGEEVDGDELAGGIWFRYREPSLSEREVDKFMTNWRLDLYEESYREAMRNARMWRGDTNEEILDN